MERSVKRYATLIEGIIYYPNLCPFTGKPNPEGEICVHKTTESVIPIPFIDVLWRKVYRSEMRVPADRQFCKRVRRIDVLMAIFLFLGPCVAAPLIVLRLQSGAPQPIPLLATLLSVSIAVAIICAICRSRLLRNVRIVDHFDGRMKVRFLGDEYATAFARLNRCGLD